MKRKLPRILIVPLLFFSCQNDMLEKMESLTPAGEQFMELVSTYSDWRSDWDKLNAMGTPLPNEASIIVLPQNGYSILPILNDNEITGFALYPILVRDGKRLTTTSPVIIDREKAKENAIVQHFLGSKPFNVLRDKGYSMNFEKDDKVRMEHVSLSRYSGAPSSAHLFCFEVHGYIRTMDASQYIYAENKIYEYTDFLYYKLKNKGVYVEKDYYGSHFCVMFPSDSFTYDEAREMLQLNLDEYRWSLVAIPYMQDLVVGIVYESPWLGEVGGGGGSSGHEPRCSYGKCAGNPCTCCFTCRGPCKCAVCHKDPCECIRDVIVRVTGETLRTALVKPITGTLDEFIVPTYRIYVEGTNKDGQALQTSLEAIRFGVKYDPTLKVVGYADAQTCPIIAYTPSYFEGHSGAGASAWQFSSVGHFIHAGTPVNQPVGAHGCIVLCGSGQMDILNRKLLEYSNAKSESELANSGKFQVVFEAATRLPLVREK